ncbi:hypothetical protein BJF96_g4505 [Verticillium dahliae]|uniref:Uncharacterized protein n=1 Tax=Verticillium dahliae TaxID=27337 RepID=A0AA45AMI5_VERDA|nr:hypothetical protein BJF96_g4505 [Verticillium dahliae]PNH52449.1 hypothetical protein VD0003_g4856 [Verticillium dahliae]
MLEKPWYCSCLPKKCIESDTQAGCLVHTRKPQLHHL